MNFLTKSFEIPTLFFLALASGSTAGFIVHDSLRGTLFTVEGDASAFAMDNKAAYENYEKAKKAGKDLATALTPSELISVAYTKLAQHEYIYSEALGSSKAMGLVDQTIQSRAIRDKDDYFEESNSFSNFVKIYNRMYQTGDETTKYWGSSPSYQGYTPVKVTNETYAEEMGRTISESLIYLVSPKTEGDTDRSGLGLTKVTKTGSNLQIDFEAHPAKSTLRYVKQMKTISNLKEYPSFYYVHLQVVCTQDLDLLYMKSFEKYQATLASGIGSACEGTMTTIYQIPSNPPVFPKPDAPSEAYASSQDDLLKKYGYDNIQ